EVGEEAVVFTPAAGTGRFTGCSRVGGAGARDTRIAFLPWALTKQGVAAKPRTIAFDTADIVGPHSPDQCQAARAHHPINEVNSTHCGLPELLALITGDIIAFGPGSTSMGVVTSGNRLGERSPTHVTAIDLQRHVGSIAEFTGNGGATDVSTEADPVQTNIFRVLEEVARRTNSAINTNDRGTAQGSKPTLDVGIYRAPAVVVHCIEAELGIVQLRSEPTKRDAELPAVACFLVLPGADNVSRLTSRPGKQIRVALGQVSVGKDQAVITAPAYHVRAGEEGTAVIRNGPMPLQLVERLHGQVLGQPLRQIQHLNRQQTFLQFRTRTAESGSIDRVDGVDTVLDEDTLTPTDDLAAEAHVAWVIANGIVVVDESVEQLDTGALLQGVAAGIIDIVEVLAAVLGLEVVPIVAADEGAGATVAQFQIVGALENLGKHISFFVIQTSVVRCPSCRLTALILAVDF